MSRKIKINEITERDRLKNLFPTDPEVLEAITEGMREEGFDPERPIFLWRDDDELVVSDGHTRLEAARQAKLKEVHGVVRRSIKNEDDAADLAVSEQRDRRNMSGEDIIASIYADEQQRQNGGSKVITPVRGNDGRGSAPKVKGKRGSTKDPVKQRTIERATRAMGKKPGKSMVDRGIAKTKDRKPEQAKTTAKKKRDIEKASLEQFAPPEMRKCHELVAHALDDLRKSKRYAREANAATLDNIKKVEKLSGEIRQIIEKENE